MRYSERQMTSEFLDQPAFHEPPSKVFICSTPRSGSYLLCRYMINAGLGVPHEYFNTITMRQIAPRLGLASTIEPLTWRPRGILGRLGSRAAARAAEVAFLQQYIDALMPRRCQNGIFGAKIHFDQFEKVLDNPVGQALLNGGVFIYLYREDLLAQAVSAHFANLTGRWSIDDTITTTPAKEPDFFNVEKLDRTLRALAADDMSWRRFLARNGIRPLSISYERFREDPYGLLRKIAKRLGIDPETMRQDYQEEDEPHVDRDAKLPSKKEVMRHFLASVQSVHDIGGATTLSPDRAVMPSQTTDS